MKKYLLQLMVYAALFASCNSELAVSPFSTSKISIDSIEPLLAQAGDEIIVSGKNLSNEITASIDGVSMTFELVDNKTGRLLVPETIADGQVSISFEKGETVLSTFPLLIAQSSEKLPILPLPLTSICDDIIFKDKAGKIVRGERQCQAETLPDCSEDGQTNCIAVDSYPAALALGAASKILTGQTLAGVSGSAAQRPASCESDGEINCVAVANYPAVDKGSLSANAAKIRNTVTVAGISGSLTDCSADGAAGCVVVGPSYAAALLTGSAAKIAAGETLAGVTGTASARPADCSADGQTSCVAVTNFPAMNKSTLTANVAKLHNSLTLGGVAGSLADCNSDGGLSCLAVAGFPAMNAGTAAAKIITGQSVGGVAGSGAIRPADCSSDGETSCVAVTNFPAVDIVGNITANAAKIRDTVTIAGVSGSLANCSSDGATGCFVVGPSYAAAVVAGGAAKIVAGQVLAGITGTAAGVRPSDCASDGEVGCVSIANFPAAQASGAAAKIAQGDTLAGIAGTAAVRPSDCSSDGQTSCVAVTNFPAVDKVGNITANAAKLRDTVTIAGVTGTLEDCDADGETICVAVAAYPAALAAGAAAKIVTGQSLAGVNGSAAARPSDCASEGGTNCVAVANFPAVDKVNNITANAGKIRDTVTIAGVAGTLDDCNSDGDTTCVAVTNFPAVDKVNNITANAGKIRDTVTIAGVAGTLDDCSSDGDTTCVAVTNFPAVDKVNNITANAAKIRDTVTIAGVAGTLEDCDADGETTCVAVTNFPAVQKSLVTAGVLKDGTTIVGVTGDYPSATYPLAGSDGTADLTSATFNAQVKSATAFEYFDSAGTRYTGAGDTDITAANIVDNIDIFGTEGTAVSGSDCTGDGQTGCVTTSRYKSMDTDSSVISAWDIRSGKTAGGIAGSIVFYKNMADLATFNRTAGIASSSSTTVADFYDTIDDYNNNGSFPSSAPSGWTAPGSNWLRDPVSDDGSGGGVASNGACDGTEHCVYKDQITGLYWAQGTATTYTWGDAITHCDGLSSGTYTDWRLATQKELIQAYTNGIGSQKAAAKLNLQNATYWSSSMRSDLTNTAWIVSVTQGPGGSTVKSNTYRILCVR